MTEILDKNMKTSSVSDWFQIAASIGVLAGLLLVGYELNRNEAINMGNLSYQHPGKYAESVRCIVAGENPVGSLMRACVNPTELTDEDYFVLDALYSFQNRRHSQDRGLSA